MDKSSLTDDSLDEVPQNRGGGENPEGDADQGVPPGPARRKGGAPHETGAPGDVRRSGPRPAPRSSRRP
jgi:hypothetical protein